MNSPEDGYGRWGISTHYEYYGFHTFCPDFNWSIIDENRTLREHFLWCNLLFDAQYINEYGNFTTWAGFDYWYGARKIWNPTNYYTGNGSEIPLPLAFEATNATYYLPGLYWSWDEAYEAEIGVYTNGNGDPVFGGNIRNCYGLTLNTLQAGASSVILPGMVVDDIPVFLNYEQPDLQTVDYYFASQTPYFTYITNEHYYTTNHPAPPLPGSPSFSETSTSPLIIAGIGRPITVSGWAKMAIANGYAGKFAYLEQYFDQACTRDTNGVATTNRAGILSPYGEFFPTMPGPAALITMPDVDTGQRGTGEVHVIKLQLDANHDGTMDLSWFGPDNTSQANPMRFWVNNDFDRFDLSGFDNNPGKDYKGTRISLPDYSYGKVNCRRDLEDFARLWICGMPALATNAGYQVTMSWTNVSGGNPVIKLFRSVETNGGALYLSDTNVASAQAVLETYVPYYVPGPGLSIGTVSNGTTFICPADLFTNVGSKYFLFEGAGIGSGQLMLTIIRNGTNIAQTGAWLDLHDVRDFYERAIITNNMSSAMMSNWTSAVQIVQPASSSALGNDTNLIVFVHGINVNRWDALSEGDTVFKRLYWAGFKGKFASVKWPCNLLTPIPDPLNLDCFNRSEHQGYKAGTALTNYIAQLRNRNAGHRINLLVHSQGNTLVGEAIRQGMQFDTYILTQGALPASAYDVNTTNNAALADRETSYHITPDWQPMGYHGAYTNLTAPSVTGRIVNFYNPLDKVLGYWIDNQRLLKPSIYFSTAYYSYNGTNSYFHPFVGDGYLVTDPHESRAMVARSRTDPIGRSGPASAHGVIQAAVNLNVQYGFNGATVDEHSAQWTRPIQTSRPYYLQILESIKP